MILPAVLFLALSQDPCADDPRDLYRRARLEEPAPELLARGADLAVAAGDAEEAVRLLSDLARESPDFLTAQDRLLLADAAEARGDRRGAIFQLGHVLTAFARRGETAPGAIGSRIRRLDAEEEAGLVAVRSFAPPSYGAQQAFADGKRLAAAGQGAGAEERFRLALRSAPGYVEPALALGALLTRSGRTPEAIAAYRTALGAEPDRFEAVLSLSNLLWAEPDRAAKEESLALLDRAAALRPDLPRLLRDSAGRWAAWGDAARALERLDAFRRVGPVPEGAGTDALRERLAASVRSAAVVAAVPLPQLASPAIGPFRLAQVYVLSPRRGDAEALAAGNDLLEKALRLDPTFAPAWDLLATLREKRGDLRGGEDALRRAIGADPARATAWERLAELIARDPTRSADAVTAWRSAEKAGSREALVHLAAAAEREGRSTLAAELYRRYLAEAPDGARADEARAALVASTARERWWLSGGLAAGLLAAVALAWLAARRWGGTTLASWLARFPEDVQAVRPHVGRLRHELFKHGRFLLRETGERLESPAARAGAAQLALTRLFGEENGRGLVSEARRELSAIAAAARARGLRLNVRGKDPALAAVRRAIATLGGTRADLAATARGPVSDRRARRLSRSLSSACEDLRPSVAQALGTVLDEAASTVVSRADLERLLAEAAGAARMPGTGLLSSGEDGPLRVRVIRPDWETIWRNLFANALSAGASTRPGVPPSLLLHVERVRDPVTGACAARFLLADDVPRPLTAEMIRGRAAERGLGIVADLVRRHEGIVDVVSAPVPGYEKAVLLELPVVEEAG